MRRFSIRIFAFLFALLAYQGVNAQTVLFEESFATDLGEFKIEGFNGDNNNIWQWDSYYKHAVADGYGKFVGQPVDVYLVSPEIQLKGKNTISFEQNGQWFSDVNSEVGFYVREGAYSEWKEIVINFINEGYQPKSVGEFAVPEEFANKSVQFGFRYTSVQSNSSGILHIQNFVVKSEEGGAPAEKADPEISFSAAEAEAVIGDGQMVVTPYLINPNDVEVVFSSSNPEVATVNEASGSVTLVGAGVTTIKAVSVETEKFLSGEASYVLTVTDGQGGETSKAEELFSETFESSLGNFTEESADGSSMWQWFFITKSAYIVTNNEVVDSRLVSPEIQLAENNYAEFSYRAGDFADLASEVKFSVREVGGEWTDIDLPVINNDMIWQDVKVEIPAEFNNKNVQVAFRFASNYGTLCIKNFSVSGEKGGSAPVEKVDPALSFAETEFFFAVDGGDFTEPVLNNPNNVNVTYSSSDESVATVDALTGDVTVVEEGTVTITAASEETEQYLAGSASYILTVTAPAVKEVIFSETFEASLGEFTVEGYNGEAGNIWFHDIAFATADAYGKISEPVENYLVSPVISLGSESHIVHYGQFQSYFNKFAKETSFCIREVGGEWVKLTIPVYPNGDWAETGNIVVPDEFSGKDVQFGFKYTAQTSNSAGVWSISDFVVEKICAGTSPNISFGVTESVAFVGREFTAPVLSNPYEVKVSYSSSNTDVATVDAETGDVTIVAEGTTTITATSVAEDAFVSEKAEYVLTVKNASAENVIFEAGFDKDFCGFAVEGFNGDEMPIWKIKDGNARADAFTKISEPNTNYLVSPIIRMSDTENIAEFNYKYMHDMNSSAAVEDEMGFCIREVGGEWQKLVIPNVSGENEMVSSGEIVIPAEFAGKKVQVAFMYYAENGNTSGVWSIDDMVIRTSDVPTGIEGISADDLKNGKVYNLQGMRVDKLGKGIYIVNGKKVVIK